MEDEIKERIEFYKTLTDEALLLEYNYFVPFRNFSPRDSNRRLYDGLLTEVLARMKK
jgi:hypothetical protein